FVTFGPSGGSGRPPADALDPACPRRCFDGTFDPDRAVLAPVRRHPHRPGEPPRAAGARRPARAVELFLPVLFRRDRDVRPAPPRPLSASPRAPRRPGSRPLPT